MRTAAFTRLMQHDKARSAAVAALLDVFAVTFGVEAPHVIGKNPDDALFAFREFTAACMEEALASPAYAARKRVELEARAFAFGEKVRRVLRPGEDELAELVSRLYSAIGIEVTGAVPGTLVFHRCSFAQRYTPALCAFMGAFDSGFVGGLAGGGSLRFEARISEGAPCCRARLEKGATT